MEKFDENTNDETSFLDMFHWVDFIAAFIESQWKDVNWIPTFDMEIRRNGMSRDKYKGILTVFRPTPFPGS